jgi:hypothetical protein
LSIVDARKNLGQIVALNGKGKISETLKMIFQKGVRLKIAKVGYGGTCILELPDKPKSGFIFVEPISIDLVPKYNLQRSGA